MSFHKDVAYSGLVAFFHFLAISLIQIPHINVISNTMQAMYIRVKRDKTTYFVQCDPTETTLEIKQKLQGLIDQPSNNQRLTLVSTNEILDDSKTLADQKVLI